MPSIKHLGSVLYSKATQGMFNLRALSYLFGIVILLACLGYSSLTIKFLIDTDVAFPVMGNWGWFPAVIISSDNGDLLSYLLRQINEHRPVILKTAMLIDYLFFGFQLRFMAAFHLLSYIVLVALFIWLAIQIPNELDRSVRNAAKVLIGASGFFLLLSMRQWEVHYGYENVGTIQCFLFFACSIYLYNKRFDWLSTGNKVTYASFAAVAFLALLSTVSMVFGLLTLPFLFIISIFRRAPRKESWWLALLSEKYVVDNTRCIGDISVMSNRAVIPQLVSDSSSMGVKLFGWAWRKQAGVEPSRILLVDQSEVIRGAGLFSVKTPDVAKSVGDPTAEDAGWVAFARLERSSTEVNGYALYEKENVVCLFKKLEFPGELVVN